MKDRFNIFLKKYPLFLYLLPLFFVLHGFRENYGFVPAKDAALLTLVYLSASIILFLIFRLLYKNRQKAGLMAFCLTAFNFFFGSVQDALRNLFPGSVISKYIFIIPLFLTLFILIVIFLKRRKKSLERLTFYLNFLLLVLIAIDLMLLVNKSINSRTSMALPKDFIACTNCSKTDVYVIIADEYAGNTELKDIFHFDDSLFLNQLAGLGFHTIPNSSSNYNSTPYSIASILNMNYLDPQSPGNPTNLNHAYETISNNNLLKFLDYHQYQFYNYSLSDFKGHPTYAQETFLPVKTKLITSQTFLNRVDKELRFLLISKFNSKSEIDKTVYANRDNNETLIHLTSQTAEERTTQPKFVLTHLMMPHYPYYYDKDGKEFPFDKIVEGNQDNQHNYIEYLQYSNKKLLQLIDHILKSSSSSPVIVLMGDHGFRHFNYAINPKYHFSNLVSVRLPDQNYSSFSDSLSNVNLFRTILNTSFGQHLPYLKDTAVIVENP